LLFNLGVDALDAILESTKKKGRIRGLVPHLLEGGVTHLLDTILMVQDREESILNVKFILYCSESMSGLKINYHKCEVFVIRGDQQRKEEIATKFNYKMGNFRMIYLGVPIHIKKLRKHDPWMINEKMLIHGRVD
jgi:hypothetical protein